MVSLLRLERKQNYYSKPFRIRIFLFLSYSSGIETISTFIHSVVPSKTIPDSRPKWAKSVTVFRPKRAKTLLDGAAHTYMAYIRKYPPPPGRNCGCNYCYYCSYMYCCYCMLMISASTLLLLPLTTTTATATSAPVTNNTFYYTASACYATGDLKVTLQ